MREKIPSSDAFQASSETSGSRSSAHPPSADMLRHASLSSPPGSSPPNMLILGIDSSSEDEYSPTKSLRARPTSKKKGVKGKAAHRKMTKEEEKQEREILRSVNDKNGLESKCTKDCQWFGTLASDTQRVHIISHSEYHLRRPNLWLKLVGLLSLDTAEASKEKRSLTNTVYPAQTPHNLLRDSDAAEGRENIYRSVDLDDLSTVAEDSSSDSSDSDRGAIVRIMIVPTRDELEKAIAILETALAKEERNNVDGLWQPDVKEWLHQEKVGSSYKLTTYPMLCFATAEDWAEFLPLSWVADGQRLVPKASGTSLPLNLHPRIPASPNAHCHCHSHSWYWLQHQRCGSSMQKRPIVVQSSKRPSNC